MSAQRVLSEDELNEQLRISAKKELLAYFKDGVPRSKKIDDAHEHLKIQVTELQVRQGDRNNLTRRLQMLPPEERLALMKRNKTLMLPDSGDTKNPQS